MPVGCLCSAGPLKALSRALSGVTWAPACLWFSRLPCGDRIMLCRTSHRHAAASSASTLEPASTEPMLESMSAMSLNPRVPTPGLLIQQVWVRPGNLCPRTKYWSTYVPQTANCSVSITSYSMGRLHRRLVCVIATGSDGGSHPSLLIIQQL